ncbi:MAG: CBS domain-containing protein [Gemmatimonadetes bacterium]|nr:CBS domain-containing protein [Gemmatimonadota bacterium]NIO32714.1 CBS domain-containing protein [Gemmatimonadota bacterium]
MDARHELGREFAQTHAVDAARVLERALPEETAAFLHDIPIAAAADVLLHMNVHLATAALSAVEVERAAGILQRLPPQHAAHLLRHLKSVTAETLLESLDDKAARSLRHLLRYREGTAGALADPQVLTLPGDMSVGDVQKQLRRLAGGASYNVYVADRDHRLVGVVTIRELLLARQQQTLESIMQRQLIRLPAGSDLATIALNPAWQEFDMLPVVDKAGVFLGVIRHKSIRQLADPRQEGPGLVALIDVTLSIADMYWRSLSGLAAALPPARTARGNEGSGRSRRQI